MLRYFGILDTYGFVEKIPLQHAELSLFVDHNRQKPSYTNGNIVAPFTRVLSFTQAFFYMFPDYIIASFGPQYPDVYSMFCNNKNPILSFVYSCSFDQGFLNIDSIFHFLLKGGQPGNSFHPALAKIFVGIHGDTQRLSQTSLKRQRQPSQPFVLPMTEEQFQSYLRDKNAIHALYASFKNGSKPLHLCVQQTIPLISSIIEQLDAHVFDGSL